MHSPRQDSDPATGTAQRLTWSLWGPQISGICSATELQTLPAMEFSSWMPWRFRGTWLIHKYPGARSDSDLHFGYDFKPWKGKPIASRGEILDYPHRPSRTNNSWGRIRYQHRVQSASVVQCVQHPGRWTLPWTTPGNRCRSRRAFSGCCQGYYRHGTDTPSWPGLEQFISEVVHPQHWPDSIDLAQARDRDRLGATAATLIPALADRCAHVTMLQRTPTYFATGRNADALADELRKLEVDEAWIHEIMRRKVVRDQADLDRAREPTRTPSSSSSSFASGVPACPRADVERHFTPRTSRCSSAWPLCLTVTCSRPSAQARRPWSPITLRNSTKRAFQLQSGDRIDCDVVVTATGFELSVMGDIPFSVDGRAVDFAQTVSYRGMMFSGVPNMTWPMVGYGRYSWTLQAELVGQFVCRLLQHMYRPARPGVTPMTRPEGCRHGAFWHLGRRAGPERRVHAA